MKQRDHGRDAVPWGPSRLARFFAGGGAAGSAYGGGPMGGTPANSHEISVTSLYFALDNIVLPEVTTQHPDWSYEDRREEAIRRIELRSADNLRKGYLPELDREGVMTTEWDIVDTASGKKMATWNGDRYTTREELWDNFEKYAKSRGEWTEALEREKSAQYQMENAILRGDAKGAATWLSHESNLARYLQVWEREDDGRIISKQYDVGTIVGRDITQQEANRVMGNISKMYAKSSVTENTSYPHVVSKEAIHIHSVSLVDGKQTVFPKEVQVSHRVSETSQLKNRIDDQLFRQNVPFDFVRNVGDQVLKNTKGTVVSIGSFLERRKADKGENLRFSELRRSGTRDIVERVRRLFGRGDVDGHEGKRQHGRLTIEKIREKPVRVAKEIEKRHREMRQNVAALVAVAETKVAIGAAPLVLAELAKEQPKPIRAVKKSIKRHERKVRAARKNFHKVQPLKTERVEPLKTGKENKRRRKRRMVYMRDAAVGRSYTIEKRKRRAVVEKLTPIVLEGRGKLEKRRLRRSVEKSVRRHKKREIRIKNKELRGIARREVEKYSMKVQLLRSERVEPSKERKQSIQRKEREAVVRVRFGWALWVLLLSSRKEVKGSKVAMAVSERRGAKLIHLAGEQEQSEQWVLRAIIYYLTAIREQAVINTTNTTNSTNTTNTQIRHPQQTIPQYAVIFVYAS